MNIISYLIGSFTFGLLVVVGSAKLSDTFGGTTRVIIAVLLCLLAGYGATCCVENVMRLIK
jgi:hypothetical protein